MAMAMKKPYGYSKVEKEDPEEMKHRRAQFLIYKVMEQADQFDYSHRQNKAKASSSSCRSLRIRISKLKVRIGKRLRRFRKKIMLSVSAAKSGFHGRIMSHLKTWRNIISLPKPLFK
ncbi:hypothetical protein QN277_001235 [Acacia crassicarpa]|uniref:Uncharacterized protein n=1 Tax=Acacia crassicarpa TaxID=499986 RepID=A0AAE1N6N9_9FABA|nr:hypothetical protein QN277_001235 [Acacia crassicarpa]